VTAASARIVAAVRKKDYGWSTARDLIATIVFVYSPPGIEKN